MFTNLIFKQKCNKNSILPKNILSKGFKYTQMHYYAGARHNTPSGIKVCIFGGNSSLGPKIAGLLMSNGSPTVMVHRNNLDTICPIGDDAVYRKSNPFGSYMPFGLKFDTINEDLYEMRIFGDLGMKYFQYTPDLTNEYDIEEAIKDCDVVINLIGNKKVIKNDADYEVPNVIIPRLIAQKCAEKKFNNVKRYV